MNLSHLKRNFPGPCIVAAMLPIFLLLCTHAHAVPDALPEQADTRSLRSGQAPIRPYARAGGGVYVLALPKSSPFIRTNGREEVIGILDHYDAAF